MCISHIVPAVASNEGVQTLNNHLALNPQAAHRFAEFWNADTQGITDVDEQRFVIQQKILENFLSAIQIEIAAIT